MTVAEFPYMAIWVAVALARPAFAYEAQHSAPFARALGGFLVSNHIGAAALADSIMFLGFGMLIVQRGSLAVRAHRPRHAPVHAGDSRTTRAPA